MGKSNLYIETKYCKNTRGINNAMIRIYNEDESYYLVSDNGVCSICLDIDESCTYSVDIKAKGFKNEVIKDLIVYSGVDSILKIVMIPVNHNLNIENTTYIKHINSCLELNININKNKYVPLDIIIKQYGGYKCVNYLDYIKYVISSIIKISYTTEKIKAISRLIISSIITSDMIIDDRYNYSRNHIIYALVDSIVNDIFNECILLKNNRSIQIDVDQIIGENEVDILMNILDTDFEIIKFRILDIDDDKSNSIELYRYNSIISYNNLINYLINSYSDICNLKGKYLLIYLINCLSLFFDDIIAISNNNKEAIDLSIYSCKEYLNISKKSNYKVMINCLYILFCEIEDKLFDNIEHTKVLYDGSIIEIEIDTILEVQEAINNLAKDYSWLNYVKINGLYDYDTRLAIKKIQKYSGLKEDGVLNKKVYNLIKSLNRGNDINGLNYSKYNISDIQNKFNILSRYYNEIRYSKETGRLDNDTINNYIAFQMLLGIRVDISFNSKNIRLIDSICNELV